MTADINADIDAAVMTIRCGYCGADAGQPCVIRHTVRQTSGLHRHRVLVYGKRAIAARPHAERHREGVRLWYRRLTAGKRRA